MTFKYIFVFSALVVLAQGSNLSPVEPESLDGALHSGVGASQGRPAISHGQRPGYGSLSSAVGGSHSLGGSGIGGLHSGVGASHGRPAGLLPASGSGSLNAAAHGLGGSGLGGSHSHGAAPRRQSGGSHSRPAGGLGLGHGLGGRPIGGGAGHGHAHKNYNRNQKPY
ncbi:hypothetical protein KR009_008451 [Drosophila setifemur]|nr:hypothetical protein KR009_008451 [Drosophila setifemur]